MSINFDSLPTEQPSSLMPDGKYLFKIKRVELKSSTNNEGSYLSLLLASNHGNVFDNISDSEKPLARFKLGQFMRALDINLTGNFELKDLVKILPSKELVAAVTTQPAKDGYRAKNIIDAFDEQIFYPADFLASDGTTSPAETEPPLPTFSEDSTSTGADNY